MSVARLGTRWARVTLAPTIAGRTGVEVPYAYGATLAGAVANR